MNPSDAVTREANPLAQLANEPAGSIAPTDPPSRERVQTVFKNVPFFSLYGLFWPQTAFFFSLRKRIWPKPNQSLRAFGRLLATS